MHSGQVLVSEITRPLALSLLLPLWVLSKFVPEPRFRWELQNMVSAFVISLGSRPEREHTPYIHSQIR